jgi:hypothetical protein
MPLTKPENTLQTTSRGQSMNLPTPTTHIPCSHSAFSIQHSYFRFPSPIPSPLLTPSTLKSWINRNTAPKNLPPSPFVIRHSDFFRHSSFVLRPFLPPSPHTLAPPQAPLRQKLPPKKPVFPEKSACRFRTPPPTPRNPRGKHHRVFWKNSKTPRKRAFSRFPQRRVALKKCATGSASASGGWCCHACQKESDISCRNSFRCIISVGQSFET